MRIEEIQYLRGVAFLAVVLQHSIAHYAYVPEVRLADGVMLAILLLISKFAVPLFIFITGLVLFYNYTQPISYGNFISKRFQDIIVPYLVWTLVYWWYYHGIQGDVWFEIKKVLLLAFTGKASYHLWYIVMIFQFYLVFPFLRPLFLAVKARLQSQRAVLGLLAILGVAYLFVTGNVGSIGEAVAWLRIPVVSEWFTEYADRNAFFFLFYFLLGAVAGLGIEHWREWLLKWQGAINTVFSGVFLYFIYRVISHYQLEPEFKINFNDLFLLRPAMTVLLVSFLLFIYIWAMKYSVGAKGTTKRWLDRLGYYSYGAYLIHALMLDKSESITDWLLPGGNATVRTLVAFALCAALSVVLTMLLSKTPIGRVVVGIGTKKKG